MFKLVYFVVLQSICCPNVWAERSEYADPAEAGSEYKDQSLEAFNRVHQRAVTQEIQCRENADDLRIKGEWMGHELEDCERSNVDVDRLIEQNIKIRSQVAVLTAVCEANSWLQFVQRTLPAKQIVPDHLERCWELIELENFRNMIVRHQVSTCHSKRRVLHDMKSRQEDQLEEQTTQLHHCQTRQ